MSLSTIDNRGRPVPVPDDRSRPFWEAAHEHRLVIQRCARCRRYCHPPVATCDACSSPELAFEQVSGRGTIYTHTVIHDTRISGLTDSLPFVVAFVDLVEQAGLRLTCNLSGVPIDRIVPGAAASVTFIDVDATTSIPDFVVDG